MECRVIKTHYDHTISMNYKTITEWSKDKLPMVVKNMDGVTIGILTWEWFDKNHGKSYKKHPDKMFRIQVSTFLPVRQRRTDVILRKQRSKL